MFNGGGKFDHVFELLEELQVFVDVFFDFENNDVF